MQKSVRHHFQIIKLMNYDYDKQMEPTIASESTSTAYMHNNHQASLPLDNVYGMLHSLDNESKLWLIDRLNDDVQSDVLGGWTCEALEEVVMMSEKDFENGRVRSNEEVMKYLLEKSHAS